MNIQCFPVKMTEEEAMRIAKKGGSFLGKLFISNKQKINLRLMYLESRYITYEMTFQDTIFSVIAKKKEKDRQKIRVMVEATTCTASYVPEEVKYVEREVEKEDIQESCYDAKRLENCGAIMAKRLVRRHLGRNLTIRKEREERVFRPFYIAIYGEMQEGTKARYLPIEADGNRISRTF